MGFGELKGIHIHGDRAGDIQGFCRKPGFVEKKAQGHGKTAGMCRGEQFIRIGGLTIPEPGIEAIFMVVQYLALGGNGTFSFL